MDTPQLDALFKAVSRHTSVGRYYLRHGSQIECFMLARAIAIRVMRDHLGMSWPAIAEALNYDSHTSPLELDKSRRDDREVAKFAKRVSESHGLQNWTRQEAA